MFLSNLQKFMHNFGSKKKFGLSVFLAMSLLAALLEFIGIVFIYPFIFLIISPEKVTQSTYYAKLTSILHTQDLILVTFAIGLFIVTLFILKNIFMVLIMAWQSKFTINWKNEITNKFMQYYMFTPYKNSLDTTVAQKLYALSTLGPQSIDGFVFRTMTLITNSVIVGLILFLLLFKFPLSSLCAALFVAIIIIIQNKFFKKRTLEVSKKFASSSYDNSNKIMQNISNLKDLKILSAQDYFYNEYLKTQKTFSAALFKNNFLSSIPPYLIESLIIVALMLIAGLISVQSFADPSSLIASYAVVVAAFFRIAPALNRIQSSVNAINSSREFVKALNEEYSKLDFSQIEKNSGEEIKFDKKIEFKNVNFSYTEDKPILKEINLTIQKGDFIGIIGLSGAGKTTLIDVLMGLLPVDSGEIFLDENPIENYKNLRKLIGYVPQQINILDKTLNENIAWGVNPDEIDENKVIQALKDAQIYEFLKDNRIKSDTMLKRLSQGQMQRLAIARVLYRNPEILILDEATSSLDVQTEHDITQVLTKLKGAKTIISIAHRLSTLKNCDNLIYMKDGKILDIGSFTELSKRHADFDNLLKLSQIN